MDTNERSKVPFKSGAVTYPKKGDRCAKLPYNQATMRIFADPLCVHLSRNGGLFWKQVDYISPIEIITNKER